MVHGVKRSVSGCIFRYTGM